MLRLLRAGLAKRQSLHQGGRRSAAEGGRRRDSAVDPSLPVASGLRLVPQAEAGGGNEESKGDKDSSLMSCRPHFCTPMLRMMLLIPKLATGTFRARFVM
jgi:hypothetical protein